MDVKMKPQNVAIEAAFHKTLEQAYKMRYQSAFNPGTDDLSTEEIYRTVFDAGYEAAKAKIDLALQLAYESGVREGLQKESGDAAFEFVWQNAKIIEADSHQPNQTVVIVYKNGTHKQVATNEAWEYENDPDYLVTVQLDRPDAMAALVKARDDAYRWIEDAVAEKFPPPHNPSNIANWVRCIISECYNNRAELTRLQRLLIDNGIFTEQNNDD